MFVHELYCNDPQCHLCDEWKDGIAGVLGKRPIFSTNVLLLRSVSSSSSSECVALQDPYCAWDKIAGKCRSHGAPRWSEENYFYQSVASGDHAACPSGKMAKDGNAEKQGYRGTYDMTRLGMKRNWLCFEFSY